MAREQKWLDPQLITDLGILQEINRRVLHPRGLALAVAVDNMTKKITGMAGIQDHRESDGGLIFEQSLLNAEKKKRFDDLLTKQAARREERLGYVIQPMVLPPSPRSKLTE